MKKIVYSILFVVTFGLIHTQCLASTNMPAIQGINPYKGQGGNIVTLKGSNFKKGDAVYLGNIKATGVTISDATTIQFLMPEGLPGNQVYVYIISPSDGHSNAVTYTFESEPLQFISITPGTGASSGGTRVEITGSGFVQGVKVAVDGTPIDSSDVTVTSTALYVDLPAHIPGKAMIKITNPDGQTFDVPFTFFNN